MIEEHPGEWEYDWRTRFRLPLSRVGGRRMSWGEAFRLALILVSDPSTRVGAAPRPSIDCVSTVRLLPDSEPTA